MTDGIWDVGQAIFDRLNGASPPISGGRIFDHVSQDTTFPYVEIGNTSPALPIDADGVLGTEEFVALDIWDRPNADSGVYGQKQIKQIMGQIHALFHKTTLTVSGRSARVWVADERTLLDADGLTEHGVVRLKVSSYLTI